MNKAQSARIATKQGLSRGFSPVRCAKAMHPQHHLNRLHGTHDHAISKRHNDVTSPIYDQLVITTNCDREPFWRPIWYGRMSMKKVGNKYDPGK